MLNSAKHEILNAHRYKKISNTSAFSGSDKPIVLFYLHINFNIYEQKKSCSAEVSRNFFNLGARMLGVAFSMLIINFKMRCGTEVSMFNFNPDYKNASEKLHSIKERNTT